MIDYATMTDSDLNRVIAEAREWIVRRTNCNFNPWRLYRPDDTPVPWDMPTLDAAWMGADSWTTDLNHAFELWDELRASPGKQYIIVGRRVVLRSTLHDGPVREWGGGSLARAICEAWLWQEKQRKEDQL